MGVGESITLAGVCAATHREWYNTCGGHMATGATRGRGWCGTGGGLTEAGTGRHRGRTTLARTTRGQALVSVGGCMTLVMSIKGQAL